MTASTCNIRNFNRIDQYFVPLHKQRGAVKRAKRCLFGPIDHDFNEKWIEGQLTQQIIGDSFKYGIDFSGGTIVELRGLKRPATRIEDDDDDDDNLTQYYFKPIEPDDNNNNSSESEKSLQKQTSSTSTPPKISGSNIRKSVKQSLLTDFMQSKKPYNINNSVLLKKDQTERPKKKLKLTDNKSSATSTNS